MFVSFVRRMLLYWNCSGWECRSRVECYTCRIDASYIEILPHETACKSASPPDSCCVDIQGGPKAGPQTHNSNSVESSAVKLRGISPDLRSGTSCLRSTTSNNRSGTSHLRSGTFLLGYTTLHSLHLVGGREPHLCFRPFGLELRPFKPLAYRDPPPLAE